MPEEDFSADLEVNPISEIGVCGSFELGLGDGTSGQRNKTGELSLIKDAFYFLRLLFFCE